MRTTLTLMLTILATFCQGECPIECYCDQVTTCTGDKLLTRFPKIYTSFSVNSEEQINPIYPTRLEVHDYDVKYLSKEDFLQMISNLTELSLTRNSLEKIDNETFSLLSSRPSTSTTLGGSGSEERHFFSTRLSSASSADSDILKLRILDLSQNKLSYFVGGSKLKRVKILDLSSNKLQQVYELSGMENLESVNLRDNRISYLQPTIFQGLKYLQYVNLDSNALGGIDPSTFSNLPALAHLILSSNPISNLLQGFYWNSRVQFVDVSHVGLTSIPTSLTKTVRDFRCANNNLSTIHQTDFESYPNVGLLVLDENQIQTVEDDAFGRLDFLTRLWMNGNRLRRIPQNLPPSLQSLHLEDNRLLNLSSGDFKNLRNLGELNLHGNRITSLPPYVFADLISLKNLDLRSNQIDVIYRDSFANLSKLQTLDMSQNPIKVIVTGAFIPMQKLSLLHLSRLLDTIEFDSTSLFNPLIKLRILELDDSPHFVLKLIQDSALSHIPNLYELNLQRCDLEDVNLVANSLSELNLQIVKLNGNSWDCHDLYGSAIHELMKKGTVVDDPVCEKPSTFKGVKLGSVNNSLLSPAASQKSPVLLELEENSSLEENSLLDFTEVTREEEEELNYTTDSVTNTPNTNSPENAPHVLDVAPPASLDSFLNGPIQSGLGLKTKNISTSTQTKSKNTLSPKFSLPSSNTSRNESNTSSKNGSSSFIVKTSVVQSEDESSKDLADFKELDNNPSSSNAPPETDDSTTIKTSTSDNNNTNRIGESGIINSDSIRNGGSSNLEEDTVPTQSYFEDISLKSLDSGKGNISSKEGKANGKKAPISMSIRRPKTEPLDKTKTNDDNTIIDESLKSNSGGVGGANGKGYTSDDGEETGPKSIDGFPSGYSDVDRLSLLLSSGNGRQKRPEAFHLKRENPVKYQSQTESTSGAIIVKTLLISAVTCLISILILLSVSYAVYRFAQRRSGIFCCSASRIRSSQEEDMAGTSGTGSGISGCARMSYKRFGREGKNKKRGDLYKNENDGRGHNQLYPQDFDSDSDQVELSGITNRLYLENEDIYHIT